MGQDWISNDRADGFYTPFNSQVVLNNSGAISLAEKQFKPSFSEVVLGEFTKWCSGLMFFPFDLTLPPFEGASFSKLRIGPNVLEVPCFAITRDSFEGYTLGEYFCDRKYNDFRDFEPYTTIQIYLPYYGFVDVNPADVNNKFIQFRLNVDFATGQALYIIGVNSNSVSSSNPPFKSFLDDENTIIIGKYAFNLGTPIPISQTGMAEMIRNVSVSVISGLMSAAGHSIVASAGLASTSAVSTAVNKTVKTSRNKKTGRQITKSTVTNTVDRTTEYDASNFQRGRAVNSCFESAADALNAMTLRPSTDRANNPLVDFNCTSYIKVVRRYANVLDVDSSYNSLYGKPLGEVRTLSSLQGYTEVSTIHFEGEGFSGATSQELSMIENAFSDGVILRDSNVTIFSINSNIQNGVFVGNPQRFVNKGDGFTLKVDANQSYELTDKGVSVTGATFVGINKISGGDLPRYEIKFSNAVSDVKVDIILTPVGTEFPVTATITNGRILSVPAFVNRDQQFDIEVELEPGYEMDNLSYSGCEFITIRQGGTKLNYTLTFGQVSGNVNVIITPKAVDYQVNVTVANGTLVGPSTFGIGIGEPFNVVIDADEYHSLTSDGVSVTGATFDRISESTQGTVTRYEVFFKDVTGDVAIVIRLQGKNFGLHVSITNGTVVSKPTFAQFDEEFEVVVSVNDGYTLTTNDVSVENATLKTIS